MSLWTSHLATRLRVDVACAAAARSEPLAALTDPLILYDYEASPWCRLVREYATILDLPLQIRPCPRETLWGEGAFTKKSRFRPEAMAWLRKQCEQEQQPASSLAVNDTDLMFPILVDHNHGGASGYGNQSPLVIQQSFGILEHMWTKYTPSVHPKQNVRRRPDQIMNGSFIPFPIRFLLLAAPSYLRPWPHCGLFRLPSRFDNSSAVRLYQSEGCAESRLVRELLCSMEIPYESIPVAVGSHHVTPDSLPIPVLSISRPDDFEPDPSNPMLIQGAQSCLDFLRQTYGVLGEQEYHISSTLPRYLYRIPKEQNLGNPSQGNMAVGAYTAFLTGSRAFVPPQAME